MLCKAGGHRESLYQGVAFTCVTELHLSFCIPQKLCVGKKKTNKCWAVAFILEKHLYLGRFKLEGNS